MFDDDEDFSIFDDKQTESLNAPKEEETTDTSSTDDSVSEDTKSDSEGTEVDKTSDTSDGEGSSETDSTETDEATEAPAETASSDQEKKDDDVAKDEPREKFATPDDIRAALAEQAALAEARQTTRKSLRSELKNELFPEGIDIDLQVRDSENGIVTGPSQIAGKLINPQTQDLFTYEEAKDYWDNAQRQIDKRVEQREQLIDAYAENNQSFFEGSQIVEQKYGAFLKSNPETAKQLLDNYLATAKVTKTGYITEMPVNVVAYYDSVMRPVYNVATQLALKQQGETKPQTTEAAKTNQSDRADLPVNSTTTPPTKKDELTSAFDRYFEGK